MYILCIHIGHDDEIWVFIFCLLFLNIIVFNNLNTIRLASFLFSINKRCTRARSELPNVFFFESPRVKVYTALPVLIDSQLLCPRRSSPTSTIRGLYPRPNPLSWITRLPLFCQFIHIYVLLFVMSARGWLVQLFSTASRYVDSVASD